MGRGFLSALVVSVLFPGPHLAAQEKEATPPEQIVAPEGFRVELLRSASEGEGSWISMTFDDEGRIIVALDRQGLARITINPDKSTSFDRIEDSLKHCRGILFAHGALYANATDSKGFFRLRDTNGDDRFDETRLLRAFDYRSRYGHGQNQIKLGPDGMLYLVVGNDCSFPERMSPDSPYRDPRPDWLLPNPHDTGQDNRVGYIVRTDPEGKTWEVVAGGLRNQVDLAFNSAGEMFTWDADMEWDVGLPWYRPTRVNHVVSGGEYGWRWGTGKWPDWRPDALPSNLDTGLGSPTGIEFGTRSHFPARYRGALFLADWQNGRILAAMPSPGGASYRFEYAGFLEGAPLNVSDFTFGDDGAMYFITGGRGSQSGLYRVSHQEPVRGPFLGKPEDARTVAARRLRHRLEEFHVRRDPAAVALAFEHLEAEDRWIRFAARLALERQEVASWRKRALESGSVPALMALARAGRPSDLEPALASFARIPLGRLEREELLEALRTLQLIFIRLGPPPDEAFPAGKLLALYPNESAAANREVLELLVFLEEEAVLDRALDQLENAPTQEEQIFIARTLWHLEDGWKNGDRRRVLQWLIDARRYRGGRLLDTTLKNLRSDFLARLTDSDREGLAGLISRVEDDSPAPVVIEAPGAFVKAWTTADFADRIGQLENRDPASGRRAAAASMCLVCHRVGEEGGLIGPDLTKVGGRFDAKTLLEAIIEPSAVISPKYRSITYRLSDGKTVSGLAAGVSGTKLRIETNPLTHEIVEIERAAIVSSGASDVSPMPPGLINTLTAEQVLDLLGYLTRMK